MDKEKAIQEINNTKQKVNEGSKAFRDQIDFNVLPIVKESAVVTELVKEARHIWTFADRGAKAKLEEAKKEIVKPTVISKLDKAIRYENFGKVIAPYSTISLLVNPGEVTDAEVDEFAEKITEGQHGNYARFLSGVGYYELSTRKVLGNFFNHDGRIYRTAEKDVNPKWLDMFRRRGSSFVDREWTIQNDFLNNCTLHSHTGAWGINPINRKNNTGFYVPELGMVHPTHERADSWRGCWMEWDAVEPGKGWWGDKYKYRSEDEMSAKHREDMNCNRAVREMFRWYLGYMIDLCKSEWGDKARFGHNEWGAAANFHVEVKDIYKSKGVETTPVTSLYYYDWYKDKAQIWDWYRGSWHGVYYYDKTYVRELVNGKWVINEYTLDDVREKFLPKGKQFIFSGDGEPWGKHGKNLKKRKETVEYCCKHGHGFELFNDFNKRLGDIDYVNLLS